MAHDFSNSGTLVSGPEASTRPGATKLPELPRKDFHLMHNPESWELAQREDGEWEWLPRLKCLYLVPGINGVRQVKGGIDDSPARLAYQDRGWTVIDRALGYVTKYPCARGQSAYLTWDRPHVMGRKIIIRHDAPGYAAFRRGLIENGTIQAPEPEALEAILHQLDKRIDRAGKSIHIPGVKARVEADQAKLDGAKKAAKKATTRKRKKATSAN
jgi:hypothetical protein